LAINAGPSASLASQQQQPQQQQHHRSLASDAAAAASSAAEQRRRPPPRQPKQRDQQQQPQRSNKPGSRPSVDPDLLRGLPFFRAGGNRSNVNRNNKTNAERRPTPTPRPHNRRPPPPVSAPQTERQRAIRACPTASDLRAYLAPPGLLEELNVHELIAAAIRASELRATDLLLLPLTPPTPKGGGAAASAAADPPAAPPPPLARRLLALVPQMSPTQLARTFHAISWRAPSPDRVPGLHDTLLPPLREAARLLAEGVPFGGAEGEEEEEGGGAPPPPADAAAAAEEVMERDLGRGNEAEDDPEQQQQQQQQPPPPRPRAPRPLPPHGACIAAMALGRLKLPDEPAVAHIAAATAERIAPRLVGRQAYLLAGLAQGLSASGRHQWAAFAAIAEAARPAVRGAMSAGSLSTLARAMAIARHADEPMYDAICRASVPLLMSDAIAYASLPPLPASSGGAAPPELGVVAAAEDENPAQVEEEEAADDPQQQPSNSSPSTAATTPPRFTPGNLSKLLWALATVHHPLRPEFFAAAAAAGAAMAPRMSAVEVVDTAWACARRRAYAPSLYGALSRRAAELADAGAMLPRQATLVAWSAAKQGHGDARLLSSFARLFVRSGVGGDTPSPVTSMMPFNLSNMAWAYGALGVVAEGEGQQGGGGGADGGVGGASGSGSSGPLVVPELPALVRCLARAALQGRFEDFKPQNLSDLAFGLSACGYGRGAFSASSQGSGGGDDDRREEHEEARLLYSRLAEAAVNQAAQLTNHSLADLCWAFAHAGAPAPRLFAHATAAAAQPGRLSGFSLGMAADLLWASAAAGHRDDALLDAAAELLPHRLEQLARDPEAVSKIRWALTKQPHAALERALDECEQAAGAAAASS
jgi:hypothetical protein